MTARPLLLFPDPRLRGRAEPVAAFDAALRALAADIVDTMGREGAIGLTAPHLGVPLRVAVVRAEPGAAARVYVNPVAVEASAELAGHEEGSVSMPGARELVERPARVRVAFRDLDGAACEEAAEGFAAAILQHEIDQLDGVFWTARLSRLKRERLEKRWAKKARAGRG